MSHKKQLTIALTIENGKVDFKVDDKGAEDSAELQVLATALMMFLHDARNFPLYLEAAEKHMQDVLSKGVEEVDETK